MKQIVGAPLSLAAWLCFVLGCVSHGDVSDSAKYRHEQDSVYELQQPMYVSHCVGDEDEAYLDPGTNLPDKYEDVSTEHLGEVNDQGLLKNLVDIIPAGTRVRIVEIQAYKNPEVGDSDTFFVRPEGALGKKWPRLDANHLMSEPFDGGEGDVAEIDPKFAVRVDRK